MNAIHEWYNTTNKAYLALVLVILILVIYWLYSMKSKYKSENFDEELKTTGELSIDKSRHAKVTLYYTDWCGWSRKFLPEWEQFAKYTVDNKLNLTLEKINCEKDSDKCSGIPHFPCVVITRANGEKGMMEDKYPRTTDGLIRFVAESV